MVDLRPDHLEIVKRILAERVPEYQVRAFGLRARWMAKDTSDLDLVVMTDAPLGLARLADLQEAFSESDLPFRVDVLDWAATGVEFREIIEQDDAVIQQPGSTGSSGPIWRGLGMAGEWRVCRLGDAVDIFDGPHATPRKIDAGPIFLGISNLANGRLDLTSTAHLSEGDYIRWTRRVTPQEGDVVFSYETRLGEAAIIPAGLKCCLGRRMGLLRTKSCHLDSRFLLYTYLGAEFQETIRSRTVHGSTVDRILLVEMPDFPIRLPSLKTQQAIACILGALDDKIELNRRMSETLEGMARAIFKSWFVDFDPVQAKMEGRQPYAMDAETAALFPDALVDSEIGSIPEGWKVAVLADVAEVVDCLHSKKPEQQEKGKLFLQVYNVGRAGNLDLSKPYYITEEDYKIWISRIEIKPGDLVITKTGRVGAIAQIPSGVNAAIGRNIVGIRAKTRVMRPRFLRDCMLSNHMRRDIHLQTSSGTILQSLHVKSISRLRLSLPPLPLVEKYDEIIEGIHGRMELNDAESRNLTELRDTLLPKLISGELRVPDAERFLTEVSL